MDLLGKRLGMFSESETSDNIEMNISGLKQISGEDKISGRPLYCKTVNFYPFVKLHLCTNYVPGLDGQKGTVDRANYIFCDNTASEKPTGKDEFLIDRDFAAKVENEYLSEMFSWIVRGSQEYYKDEKVDMPEEYKTRFQAILNSTDSIKCYMERKIRITKSDKDRVTKAELFADYQLFCHEN